MAIVLTTIYRSVAMHMAARLLWCPSISVPSREIYLPFYTNPSRHSPCLPKHISSPSSPYPSSSPPTSAVNAQAGVAGQEASVGPARLARAPTRSSQSPKSYWVGRVGEKMAVAVPQRARWGGKAERREDPASYRGLGLVVPWLGYPALLRGRLQRLPAPG